MWVYKAESNMATITSRSATHETVDHEFDEIFRQHYPLIYRTAFGVTGSPEDAEDVLQTIFLRLLGRAIPPDLTRNPRAYFYRAAVNVSLNVVRAKRRELPIEDVEKLPGSARLMDPEVDQGTRQRLLHAISRLNSGAVEVLMLRYVHNYSDAEIAKLLGTTRGTVAVSLYRSRSRIRKLMREAGEKS
jgi:RNA polymerase sigma-70 factor (ECF subfamily)